MRPASGPRLRRFAVVAMGALVAVTAALTGASGTSADQISDKQAQRNQQSGLISSLQAQIAAAQGQETQLQAVIVTLQGQIQQTEASINAAQATLDQITAQLQAEQATLAATEAKLARDKQALGEELKAIYEAGNQNTPVNNLVGAKSFNDFWTSYLDTQRVADQEQTQVDKVDAEKRQVEQIVAAIAAKRAQQQAVVDQLNAAKAQLADQMAAQQQAKQQLDALIAQDQQRMAEAQAMVAALDAEIAQLQAEQAAAAAAGGGNGRFGWPLQGPISQGYGCTPYTFEMYDPNCPSRHFHTGIDIAAGCGANIHASAGGYAYAYYSSWGFGYHVIIVHGNGWTTLYGHMSYIGVGGGQWVGRGQYIGNEGSTGNSTGCHLHFEIDRNGNSVNPYDYLP